MNKKQLTALLFSLTLSVGMAQNKVFVKQNATGTNNGSSWNNAYTDLQTAIDNTPSGGQVWVAGGTYQPVLDLNGTTPADSLNAAFVVSTNHITLYGGFAGTESSVSARNLDANPTIFDGNLGASNLKVLLFVTSDSVTVDGFEFTKAISNESSVNGYIGALKTINYGVTVKNSRFFDNSSFRGGAISTSTGTLIVDNCEFYNNTGTQQAGAIYAEGTSTITHSVFHHNTSPYGGAIKFSYSNTIDPHTVENCVFYENNATIYGDAIQMFAGAFVVANSTFYNNGSTASDVLFSTYDGNSVEIVNCILWNSDTITNIKHIHNGIDNYTFQNCITFKPVSGVNMTVGDPLFVDTVDFALSPCSPAINAGDQSLFTTYHNYDILGNARLNGATDLGAVEYAKPTYNNTLLNANLAGVAYQWIDCNNGNGVINGETSQTFTPTENGSYAVVLTEGSCIDTSVCVAVTNLGDTIVDGITEKQHIGLFPNPASDIVQVMVSDKVQQIAVYDTYGRMVITTSEKMFSVAHLPKGIYVVNILREEETTQIRMIKK